MALPLAMACECPSLRDDFRSRLSLWSRASTTSGAKGSKEPSSNLFEHLVRLLSVRWANTRSLVWKLVPQTGHAPDPSGNIRIPDRKPWTRRRCWSKAFCVENACLQSQQTKLKVECSALWSGTACLSKTDCEKVNLSIKDFHSSGFSFIRAINSMGCSTG